MDNCSEKPLCSESPQCTYVRTDEHTDCYWSVLCAATQFGSQDAAIWGGELKDNLDK